MNAAETGHLLGDQSAVESVTAPFRGADDVVTAYGMLVDTFDVSGARGRDILLYGILALLLAGSMLVVGGGWATWKRAAVAAAIVASPFLLLAISEDIGRPGLVRLYDALGKPEGFLGQVSVASPTVASDTASWFGPVGFLGALGAIFAAAGRAGWRSPARESRARGSHPWAGSSSWR